MTDTLNIVVVISSVGTLIGPIIFGFVIFKMLAIFVSKQQFEDYKVLAETERTNMKETLCRIERKIDVENRR